ncbi:MAG TPA: TldD/PmbA family protein [Candidatus Baltobacteraceae bacterium]|jgi:PmbA protein|nr:TldD/PmbA family protein [Candidatus Baltobacteraceae bacterium]
MNEDVALDAARQAVEFATRAGADASEASVSVTRRFHVEARAKAVSKLEQSTGKIMQMRLFSGGRKVSLSTSDFNAATLQGAIAAALEQARFVADDPCSGIPERCGRYRGDLALFDTAIEQRDDAAKVDDALALEQMIRDADPRIVNSGGSNYADTVSVSALANSGGFAESYTGTRANRSTSPVGVEDEVKRTAHYGTAGRAAADLEIPETVARIAARRTVEMFGAKKPPTGRMPVIFERDVAASVLDDIFSAIAAANVAVGNSWLADRVGERVGSDLFTVFDDGTLPGRLGSSPFDGEGVPTQRTAVFERGVLRTFLYDSYYARKLGAQSTGNSTGGGIGANNFFLEAGDRSLEELIASTAHGVLVLDTIGFSHEHATGSYSRGARGFMIENGELSYPIDEFTVAGSFPAMLAGIDGVANDLRFDGSIISPSFRVAEMTISGN